MANDHMMKVLRASRIELNPEKEVKGLRLHQADVLEVEWPDGQTAILGRTWRVEGSYDLATDPVGSPEVWNRLPHSDFETAVAFEKDWEERHGTYVGGPVVLVEAGSPVMEPGPDPAKLERF